MCNLYANKNSAQEIADHFRASAATGINAPGEVYPQYPGLVVRKEDGKRILQQMTWGFPLRLKSMKPDSKPKPVNNARDDKLRSGMWRHWFETPAQRCLIPFSAFAEAEGAKGKMTRTWISTADQEIAAWAGLWRTTDVWGDCYTGVMVDATQELCDIHDRMPVILHTDDHDIWLNASADEAFTLVTQYPADRLAVERTSEAWRRV